MTRKFAIFSIDFHLLNSRTLNSYVVVENLRYMLYQYSSSQPVYFGCKFKPYVKQVSLLQLKRYQLDFTTVLVHKTNRVTCRVALVMF